MQLERTCKRYVNVERTRRIAIGNALGLEVSREPLDRALINYINNTSDSSTVALQKFLSEIKPHQYRWLQSMDAIIFRINKMTTALDPVSFEVFLESTNYNRDVLFELIDMKFGSRRDFQIAKFLLREDNNDYGYLKRRLLGKMRSKLEDEGGDFTERFFHHSLDFEVMRVFSSIEGEGEDDDNQLDTLKKLAFLILT